MAPGRQVMSNMLAVDGALALLLPYNPVVKRGAFLGAFIGLEVGIVYWKGGCLND